MRAIVMCRVLLVLVPLAVAAQVPVPQAHGQERLYGILKSETDVAVMRERIRAINGDVSAQALTSPWFRFFLTYDPASALRTVRIPTLAMNGEKDVQVPFDQNLPAIAAAAAGKDRVGCELLDRLPVLQAVDQLLGQIPGILCGCSAVADGFREL